ncbi:hypothetical protein [Yoonia sp.]|uniref:hypothetical protein n=1 Tax=Yoonia sp. TaxID=2212373 RepID=UPI0025EE5950|nr:hypothetical protein [Yoonia sp.]
MVDQQGFDALLAEHDAGTITISADNIRSEYVSDPLDAEVGANEYRFSYIDNSTGQMVTLTEASPAQHATLIQQHNSGEITIISPTLENPAAVRIYWSEKALAQYDQDRTVIYNDAGEITSGASALTRVAQSYGVIHDHFSPATETTSFNNRVGQERTGTSLDALINTDAVTATSTMTDGEAISFLFETLGVSEQDDRNLFTAFGNVRGATNIADVAGHWAQNEHNHPDHEGFFGGHGNISREQHVGDLVSTALVARGRDTSAIDATVAETTRDIRAGRTIDALVDVALVVTLVPEAAALFSFETALARAGVDATEQETAGLLTQSAENIAQNGKFVPFSELLEDASSPFSEAYADRIAAGAPAQLYGSDLALGGAVARGAYASSSLGAVGIPVYMQNEQGLCDLSAPVIPGDFSTDHAAGLTTGEQIDAIRAAQDVAITYLNGGLDVAVDVLDSYASDHHSAFVSQVVSLLRDPLRTAVHDQLFGTNPTLKADISAALNSGDIAGAVALLEADGNVRLQRDILVEIDQRDPDAVISLLAGMSPDAAAQIIILDQSLQLNDPTTPGLDTSNGLFDSFMALNAQNPAASRQIMTVIANTAPDIGAHLLWTAVKFSDNTGDNVAGAAGLLLSLSPTDGAQMLARVDKIDIGLTTGGSRRLGATPLSGRIATSALDQGGSLLLVVGLLAFSDFQSPRSTPEYLLSYGDTNDAAQLKVNDITALLDDPVEVFTDYNEAIGISLFEKHGAAAAADDIIVHQAMVGNAPPFADPIVDLFERSSDSFVGDVMDFVADKSPETAANIIIDAIAPDSPFGSDSEATLLDWFKEMGPEDAGKVALWFNTTIKTRAVDQAGDWEDTVRTTFDATINEYFSDQSVEEVAAFLGEVSPESAAHFLSKLYPGKSAAVIEEMLAEGNAAKAALILSVIAKTAPASVIQLFTDMTFAGAAKAIEALEVANALDPAVASPKSILDGMTEGDAAAILSHVAPDTAVNIFSETESGTDYNRMFGILTLMDNGASANAVTAAGIPGGAADGAPIITGGEVDEDYYDDINRPAFIFRGVDTPVTIYGELLADGVTPVIVADVYNPENEDIISQGYRRLAVGFDGADMHFVPVDANNNIIAGYIVRYDESLDEFTAVRTPENFPDTRVGIDQGHFIRLGRPNQSTDSWEAENNVVDFDGDVSNPLELPDSLPIQVDWTQWDFEPPAPNPLGEIRRRLADRDPASATAEGANYLTFLVHHLPPAEANNLSATERMDIARIAYTFDAQISGPVAHILGARPPEHSRPSGRIPSQALQTFVDAQNEVLIDRIYTQYGPTLARTDMSDQEMRTLLEGIMAIAADVYNVPVPTMVFPSTGTGAHYNPNTNQISISPRAMRLFMRDPLQGMTTVVHEMTHAQQFFMFENRDTNMNPIGSAESDIEVMFWLGTRLQGLYPDGFSYSEIPGVTGLYYRSWHEGHAYYVEDRVSLGVARRLQADHGVRYNVGFRNSGGDTVVRMVIRLRPAEAPTPVTTIPAPPPAPPQDTSDQFNHLDDDQDEPDSAAPEPSPFATREALYGDLETPPDVISGRLATVTSLLTPLVADIEAGTETSDAVRRLLYVVDHLDDDEAKLLTGEQRSQILRLTTRQRLPMTERTSEILATRAATPEASNLPTAAVQAEVDQHIDIIFEGLPQELLERLRATDITQEEAKQIVAEIFEIVKGIYGLDEDITLDYDVTPEVSGGAFNRAGNDGAGTLEIDPEALEQIMADPLEALNLVVHELTHAYQYSLIAEYAQLPSGGWESDLARAVATSSNFWDGSSAGNADNPLADGGSIYHRLWHEGHAFYVGDSVQDRAIAFLNQDENTDIESGYTTDAETGEYRLYSHQRFEEEIIEDGSDSAYEEEVIEDESETEYDEISVPDDENT